MADNPIALLREVLVEALASAGFERVPVGDPFPAATKYWLRIEGARPSPNYETDAAGITHVWRRSWAALAAVEAHRGDSDALDAAIDDGVTQLRYVVEAYPWDAQPAAVFAELGKTVRVIWAEVEEDSLSALYDEAKGLIGIAGYIDYTEG